IAVADIPLGTVVTTDMVTKQNISIAGKDADTLADPSQAIGQTARRAITTGAQVHASDFKISNVTQLDVPTGKRAFAIETNELTGVGNLVNVGDNVDVLITLGAAAFPVVQVLRDGTITVVTGLNATSVKLPLLLENVQILGTIDAPVAAPANGAAPAASGPPTLSDVNKLLILSVTPAQAEVLLFARTTGTLDVVLRSPLDTNATVATDGVILKTLIDKYGLLPPQLVQTIVPTAHP
ncbi:MAG: Flp pilus assembly protein RcpC/CpaB, partial [Chloroflexota bacterium]|nr:Flp pilus assembly protein RcpC/CpaB [Chloroflexota bacterium]